jgi:hypothetical protein
VVALGKKAYTTTITAAFFVVLTLGSLQIAGANPVPWSFTPNEELPTLTIQTPQNYSTSKDSNVALNFMVTWPDSWNKIYWYWHVVGEVVSVDVFLDGNISVHYTKHQTDLYLNGNKTTQHNGNDLVNFSLSLNQTTTGTHTLKVTVLSYTYYKGILQNASDTESGTTSNGKPIYQHPRVVSDTVYFTVGEIAQNTEPTPTVPEFPTTLPITLATIAAILAVAVVKSRKRAVSSSRV